MAMTESRSVDWKIIGHDWAVKLLKQHLKTGQTRHAYLFAGPNGIGRRTLAIRFAQALNCSAVDASFEPCGECRICRQFERMQHPDLSVIDVEDDSQSVKVDQIRELQRTLSLTPLEGRYRVALLLNFQNATESAQNALLKTLEEAPTQVILLLTVDSVDHLLPTIVSRCEILRLRTQPVEALSQYLVDNFPVNGEEAKIIASVSGGRVGEAIGLIAEPEKAQQRKRWVEALVEMIRSDRLERMQYAEKTFRYNPDLLGQAFEVWLTFWRDVLVFSLNGASDRFIHVDFTDEIHALHSWLTTREIQAQINALLEFQSKLESNVNPQLLAELALLELPRND